MARENRPHDLICPICGWSDIRAAKARGFWDRLLAVFALAPYRCRKCRARFHRFAWFARRPAPMAPIDERVALEPPAPPVSILLVDPDQALRKLLGRRLRGDGYAVREAPSARDAIAELKASKADLVVANLNDDGACAIRKLRNANPELKIIVHSFTGPEMFSEELAGKNAGRLLVIKKPSRASEVIERVREMVPATR
ncbi:MAG TPA: response regulator [Bryobacteraceae bacterium]|nr:response regulator [Bryobacteraceae bacterium]